MLYAIAMGQIKTRQEEMHPCSVYILTVGRLTKFPVKDNVVAENCTAYV